MNPCEEREVNIPAASLALAAAGARYAAAFLGSE
jgi:hypothetical protein